MGPQKPPKQKPPRAAEYTGAEGLASRTANRNVVAQMKEEGTSLAEHKRTSRGPHRGRR